jgi:hypothetical protein
MTWSKTILYQTTIKVAHRSYAVCCEQDRDGGFAVYVNKNFLADVESLPSEEELTTIIADNTILENTIKTGLLAAGAFE